MLFLLTNKNKSKSLPINIWDATGEEDIRKVAASCGYNDPEDVAVILDHPSNIELETLPWKSMSDFEDASPNEIEIISIQKWWDRQGRKSGIQGISESRYQQSDRDYMLNRR